MAKVSVIVPCYNAVQTLPRCLESLVHQTLEDIEILCIDDGSTDETLALLQEYEKEHPAKIIVFHKQNGGVASVRNYGLDRAEGEYIGFVDSDDYVETVMFERLYELAKIKGDAKVVSSNFWFTYNDREVLFEEYPYKDTRDMLVHIYAVLWNRIYRRDWLEALRLRFPTLTRHEDASFLLRLALKCDSFVSTSSPFYHYVQREGSITRTNPDKTKDAVNMLEGVLEYYKQNDKEEEYHEELEYVFIRFCLGDPYRYTCKIQDAKERKKALTLLWDTLNAHFPKWKDNRYLRILPGLKHRYWRMMNPLLYYGGSTLFRFR